MKLSGVLHVHDSSERVNVLLSLAGTSILFCKARDPQVKSTSVSHCDGMHTGTSVTIHTLHDARHEKTDLKVFVVVIPKEGWARMAAPILLLV